MSDQSNDNNEIKTIDHNQIQSIDVETGNMIENDFIDLTETDQSNLLTEYAKEIISNKINDPEFKQPDEFDFVRKFGGSYLLTTKYSNVTKKYDDYGTFSSSKHLKKFELNFSRVQSNKHCKFLLDLVLTHQRQIIMEYDPKRFEEIELEVVEERRQLQSTNELFDYIYQVPLKVIIIPILINILQIFSMAILLKNQRNNPTKFKPQTEILGVLFIYPLICLTSACLMTFSLSSRVRVVLSQGQNLLGFVTKYVKKLSKDKEYLQTTMGNLIVTIFGLFVWLDTVISLGLITCILPLLFLFGLFSFNLNISLLSWPATQDIILVFLVMFQTVFIIDSSSDFIDMLFNFAGILIVLELDDLICTIVTIDFKVIVLRREEKEIIVSGVKKSNLTSDKYLRNKVREINESNFTIALSFTIAMYFWILVLQFL